MHSVKSVADFLQVDVDGFDRNLFAPQDYTKYTLTTFEQEIIEKYLGHLALPDASLTEELSTHAFVFPVIMLDTIVMTCTTCPCGSLFFKFGFSLLEDWGIWTIDNSAMMGFRVKSGVSKVSVTLNLTAYMGRRSHFDLFMGHSMDHSKSHHFVIENHENRRNIELECPVSPNGVVRIYFYMPFLKEKGEDPVADPRALGIGLYHICVKAMPLRMCPV